eukprot:UN12822
MLSNVLKYPSQAKRSLLNKQQKIRSQNLIKQMKVRKCSAAFCSKLPKFYSRIGHDMRLKISQMGHVTSF